MNIKKILLSIPVGLCCLTAFGQQSSATLPKCKNGFVVIAHRGSHLVKPENTVAAIEDAIRLGADYVEIDLRTTKDGHLMLSHNETVDGRTNGKGLVSALTWEEISKLSVNSTDGQVYKIPTFKEALKACKGKINIYLDFKDADAAQAYQEIAEQGMEKSILVYLNKAGQYEAWRKTAPQMPLMGRLPENLQTREELKTFLNTTSLKAVDKASGDVLLAALKAEGVSVFLDAQSKDENPAKWKALMHEDVQGLQTDHPEALIGYLNQNGWRNGLK